MYTGSIALSLVNLTEVLRLADFLRARDLMSLCADYMGTVRLSDDPAVCLSFVQLVDAFHLSLVSPSLVSRVHDAVSEQLPGVFTVLTSTEDEPPAACVVARLLTDPEIGAVLESDVYTVVSRLAGRRPHDAATLDLLDRVEFDYLSVEFALESVLTNVQVVGWLERRRPKVLAALRDRVERLQGGVQTAVDIVVCGKRFPPTRGGGDPSTRLLLYVIQDDKWIACRSPVAEPGSSVAGCDWLAGLECLVTDGCGLYALCSVSADAVSYVQTPSVIKRFCRLDLSGGGPHWRRLSSPGVVQSHCRLLVSVDGVYAVDVAGVVERYSTSVDRWDVVCRDGFPTTMHHGATLYVLPMLVGGDSQLCALRVYSCGVGSSWYYASRCVTLYALDVTHGVWNELQRSDIDVADLLAGGSSEEDASTVNFHSYVATPGSLRLLDEIGRERATYDLVHSDWVFPDHPPAEDNTRAQRPRFVGSVLGSAPHAGRVYCACVNGSADFVMYDVTRRRYKMVGQPTDDSPSGVMCHARVSRSSLALITSERAPTCH